MGKQGEILKIHSVMIETKSIRGSQIPNKIFLVTWEHFAVSFSFSFTLKEKLRFLLSYKWRTCMVYFPRQENTMYSNTHNYLISNSGIWYIVFFIILCIYRKSTIYLSLCCFLIFFNSFFLLTDMFNAF